MAGVRLLLPIALAAVTLSCSFLLDFGELQEGSATPSAGAAGVSGSGGAGGTAGGGSGGSAGGSVGVPLDEAAAAVAEALCAKVEFCAGAAAMETLFFDEECTVAGTSLIQNTVIATIEANGSNYDPALVPDCIAAFEALTCEEVSLTFPEACKEILGGLKGDGESCTQSLECGVDLYCSTEACPGSCRAPLAQGEPCTTLDLCAPGLTCFFDAPANPLGSCEPLGGEGSPCAGTVLPGCLTGFVCVGNDDAAMEPGTCHAAKDLYVGFEDSLCSLGNPPTLCREGLSCPFALVPRCLAEAPRGGTCQLAVPDMCPAGQYCNGGTCADLPGAGEPCAAGIVLKPTCQAYLRCLNDTCRPLGQIGDICGLDQECYSGTCAQSECAAPSCE